jgi:hypothetical protein
MCKCPLYRALRSWPFVKLDLIIALGIGMPLGRGIPQRHAHLADACSYESAEPVHDFLYLPHHHRYTRRKPTRLKFVHEAPNATPCKPILSALTNKKLMATWKMRARAAHHVHG